MGSGQYFDLWLEFQYQWKAIWEESYNCGLFNLFTCYRTITSTLTYDGDLQLGRPGRLDGDSASDEEIWRQKVNSDCYP
ncbi:MAG: hypothetical protein OEZ01_02105 [Candidatus Heimdallarchaeota archaeon]|nr:hypothetical protein [Candidatus Heimdallarchaeota archaeon]MDH5644768.1 hypothetical protein [Candidatus Heimdallarchaeota archaeon]